MRSPLRDVTNSSNARRMIESSSVSVAERNVSLAKDAPTKSLRGELMKGTSLEPEISPNEFQSQFLGVLEQMQSKCSHRSSVLDAVLGHFKLLPASREINETMTLDELRIQVQLRLHLWAAFDALFVKHYSKLFLSKRSKKQKRCRVQPEEKLLADIIKCLEMGAFRWPREKPFVQYLEVCLSPTYDSLSKVSQRILDHFELPNPFAPIKRQRQTSDLLLQLSPPKRPKRQREPQPIRPKEDSKPLRESCNHLFSRQEVSLTVPVSKQNSLLTNRARFVGSHFNTNLFHSHKTFRTVPTRLQPIKNSTSKNSIHPQIASKAATHSSLQTLERPDREGLVQTASTKDTAVSLVDRNSYPESRSATSKALQIVNGKSVAPAPKRPSSLVAEAMLAMKRRQARKQRQD